MIGKIALIMLVAAAKINKSPIVPAFDQTRVPRIIQVPSGAANSVVLISIENHGLDHPQVASAPLDLALNLNEQAKNGEAEPLYHRALAIREKVHGPDHPEVAIVIDNLAIALYSQGKYEDAELLHRRTLATKETVHGPDHPEVASTLNYLADLLCLQGKFDEAEPLYRRALAIE